MLEFNYALKSESTGLFYTGMAGGRWIAPDCLGTPAFAFTEGGAYRKLESFSRMALAVNDFTVVRRH